MMVSCSLLLQYIATLDPMVARLALRWPCSTVMLHVCFAILLSRMLVMFTTALFTAEYMPEGKSFVFNAGAPAWGADWCPTYPDDRPRKIGPSFSNKHCL